MTRGERGGQAAEREWRVGGGRERRGDRGRGKLAAKRGRGGRQREQRAMAGVADWADWLADRDGNLTRETAKGKRSKALR